MSRLSIKARIHGRVQGVWYRNWVERTASDLGINGWVRNRLDGSVEALFIGESSTIDEMITACHDGPPSARVDAIDTVTAQGIAPSRFDVKPTV